MYRNPIWKGVSWIGCPTEAVADGKHDSAHAIEAVCFRHDFTLAANAGSSLLLSISASSRYRLWVNGTAVISGPCKSGRWEKHYETVDVSSLLREGSNVLAAKVLAFPAYEAQSGDMCAPFWFMGNAAGPALVVQGICLDEAGGILVEVSTGKTGWSVLRDASMGWRMQYMSFWMGAMEAVDLESAPDGWQLPVDRLHASGTGREFPWLDAETRWAVEPNGFGEIMPFPLTERPIPLPYETTRQFEREMTIRKEDLTAFSFGSSAFSFGSSAFSDGSSAFSDGSSAFSNGSSAFLDGASAFSNGLTAGQVVLPAGAHVAAELDAGELTTAFLSLPLAGGKGSRIVLTYAESYSVEAIGSGTRLVKARRDDAVNGRIAGNRDEVIASGRDQVYEPFLFRTFRFLRMEVQVGEEPLTLSLPTLRETGYPLEVKSSISASADWMAPIWDMSVRTLRRCMHETYMDCPYYEQLQYTMDTRLQMLYTYAVSGDDRLARKAIYDFHASLLPEGILQSRYPSDLPQVIPGFALYWVFMLEEHWWETGSVSEFRRYRPTVDAVLDWFDRKIGPEGLIVDVGHWDFADWVPEWDKRAGVPFAVDQGPSTIHNLVYAAALRSAACMMRESGRDGVAMEYGERADRILEAIDRLCWCEEESLFGEGPGLRDFSQHAQVWAVLSGLADGERAKRVMREALHRPGLYQCTFPWMFTLFRALEKADLYEETDVLWDMWRGLPAMALTTIPEIPVNTRSDCHAWGALPLWEFPRKVLGVQPAVPGWRTILIEPKALFLPDASGEAITPHGPVFVSWKLSDEKFTLECRLPEGIPADIRLPDGSVHAVAPDAARKVSLQCALHAGKDCCRLRL